MFGLARTLTLAVILIAAVGASIWMAMRMNSGEQRLLSPERIAAQPHTTAQFGKLPLSFELNQGQFDPRVLFAARSPGGTLFFTREGLTMALPQFSAQPPLTDPSARFLRHPQVESVVALRMALDGANREPEVEALEKLPGIKNYLIGRDPEKWHTHVPIFAKVAYRNIYPRIDLIFYGTDGQLEYDFDVSPGADPDQIRMRFEGAETLSLVDGDLLIRAGPVDLRQPRPRVYDRSGASRREIQVSYRLEDGKRVGFDIPRLEGQHHLLIDPVLAYSTYLGGSGPSGDYAQAIAVDSSGSAYVVGAVTSIDFPTTDGSLQPKDPQGSVPLPGFGTSTITKLDPTGSSLVYSTYVGGREVDGGYGEEASHVVVSDAGFAYICGQTDAPDFPVTAGGAQTVYGGGPLDGYVLELSPDGARLVYATFLGGSDPDAVFGMDLDMVGNAYLGGVTAGSHFPTSLNALQKTFGGGQNGNGVFAKLNPDGTQFIYKSYLGGSGSGPYLEDVNAVRVNSQGDPVMLGYTASSDILGSQISPRPLNADGGGGDAFLTRIASDGQSQIFFTFLGGNGVDYGWDFAFDAMGNTLVVGQTGSTDFPGVAGDALQQTNMNAQTNDGSGPFDAFISLLSPTGAVLYATYFGGTGDDRALGVALDENGVAHIAGITTSTDLTRYVKDALHGEHDESLGLDHAQGGGDYFLGDFTVDGGFDFFSYLGGSDSEMFIPSAYGVIALDPAAATYVIGSTASENFPVSSHAFQRTKAAPQGIQTMFVVKVVPTPLPARITSISPNSGPCTGTFVHVQGSNMSSQCMVDFGGVASVIQAASPTQLQLTAGPHCPGMVDATVSCLGSPPSVLSSGFTFTGDCCPDAGPDAGVDAGDGGGDGGPPSGGCGCKSSTAGASESVVVVAAALLVVVARRRRSHA